MAAMFPGLRPDQLPEGKGWALEKIKLTTHNGTHLDAPWHYHPTQDGGRRALTIDEIPLDWCFRPGVKLDFRHFPDGYVCTAGDVEAELRRIGHDLRPLDIVVVNTSAGRAYGQPDYLDRGCGMGREATLYLTSRGVRITGTDGWSWDAPFSATARRFAEKGDPSIIWEGHKAGAEIGYCHIEKLSNLEELPPSGFMVACFPVKIEKASAGWTRASRSWTDGMRFGSAMMPHFIRWIEQRGVSHVETSMKRFGIAGYVGLVALAAGSTELMQPTGWWRAATSRMDADDRRDRRAHHEHGYIPQRQRARRRHPELPRSADNVADHWREEASADHIRSPVCGYDDGHALSHDGPSARRFPRASGCAGEIRDAVAGSWRVIRLAGAATPVAIQPTIEFSTEGRISGRSGCNRYSGPYLLTAEGLSFGPAAATRMACPPPQMQIEQRFFESLTKVTRATTGPRRSLRLMAGDSEVMVLQRSR